MFDTITAPLTPNIASSIGVIRISGALSLEIAKKITGLKDIKPRFAHYTGLFDSDGELLDRAVVLFFQAPNSFTGEDCVELQCHGSLPVITRLLELICSYGARMADRGEFSKRAFLNGKIDLAQAEAICDLIMSGSLAVAKANLQTMEGSYSAKVSEIRGNLEQLRVLCEANIDFSDDMYAFDFMLLREKLDRVKISIDSLISKTEMGIALNKRKKVVLTGSPNAGKSSIFNKIMEEDLAIISEIAGTTRDILKTRLNINGIELDLLDTAGIRSSDDTLEQEGIKRAKQAVVEADLILYIYDSSLGIENLEKDFKKNVESSDKNVIILVNKIDLLGKALLPKVLSIGGNMVSLFSVSATTGSGLVDIIKAVEDFFDTSYYYDFSARIRHKNSLLSCRAILDDLADANQLDMIAEALRLATRELDFIFGKYAEEDLLGEIFSKFCIGK